MPARFESKVVVVTGGSSGIGWSAAERVAAEGAADEIAAFVAFLLSDEAAFISGAALPIDGGFTAQ
jgi:NAD(P)-dependent dehydrogenase (short-subunit alcohol dehydrogenase family)